MSIVAGMADVVPFDEVSAQANRRCANTISAIKRYRGLTDAQIGEIIGMRRSTVSSYVSGVAKSHPGVLDAIGRALDDTWTVACDTAAVCATVRRRI